MRPRSRKWARCRPLLVAALCLTGSRAPAQQPCLPPRPPQYYFPPPGYAPCMPAPVPTAPVAPAPGTGERPPTGAPPTVPPGGTGTQPGAAAPAPTPTGDMGAGAAAGGAAAADTGASFAGLGGGAGVGSTVSLTGYIDSAIPVTQFRLRFDAAYDSNRPDRADFFYPKCGCFKAAGVDPKAPGPGVLPARRVDYQELSSYMEVAVSPRLSGFAELPLRWIDIAFAGSPSNDNHHDIGDVNFGFKYAFVYEPGQVLTAQLRTYAPTGDSTRGLGRNNWNLEPALLAYQRLGERLYFEGEVRDFIPVASADDFAGNVLRYGAGLSYLVIQRPGFFVAPVGEVVGWTVLSGKESDETGTTFNAAGDTIVNVKTGVRIGFGEMTQPGFLTRADIYAGYGRALTGDVWYKDIWRVEFRLRF